MYSPWKACFENASEFNKDLSNWKNQVKADVNTQNMFTGSDISTMPDWEKEGGSKAYVLIQQTMRI